MVRKIFWVAGISLAMATVSAGSILLYEQFGPRSQRDLERDAAVYRSTERSSSALPLTQAIDIATRQVPGEVIKVELEDEHGRAVFEIKVLAANGRVREIKLDGQDGRILEIEDD
jgi:uncharacterized membrane protein YkoI